MVMPTPCKAYHCVRFLSSLGPNSRERFTRQLETLSRKLVPCCHILSKEVHILSKEVDIKNISSTIVSFSNTFRYYSTTSSTPFTLNESQDSSRHSDDHLLEGEQQGFSLSMSNNDKTSTPTSKTHKWDFSITYEDVINASHRITAAGGWTTPILTSQSLDDLATDSAIVKNIKPAHLSPLQSESGQEHISEASEEEEKDSIERMVSDAKQHHRQQPIRRLFFKVEAFQRTGSFKFRGAANAISSLLEESETASRNSSNKKNMLCNDNDILHVVTHSAGNHAQGLALAGKLLSDQLKASGSSQRVQTTVIMPQSAPMLKQEAVKSYGANLILVDDYRPTREKEAARIVNQHLKEGRRAKLIPPFEDTTVMAGQGTVALEMVPQVHQWLKEEASHSEYSSADNDNDLLNLDCVIIPVGGGALASGCSIVLRHLLGHKVKIVLVEPSIVNDTQESFRNGCLMGHPPDCNIQSTVADGLRAELGPMQWLILRELVDNVVSVTEEDILLATKLLWQRLKVVVEPSAAVGLAAVLSKQFCRRYKLEKGECERIGIILCGGNCDIQAMMKLMS